MVHILNKQLVGGGISLRRNVGAGLLSRGLAVAVVLACGMAQAQPAPATKSQASERREAAAVAAESKQGQSRHKTADYRGNALKRCEKLPGDQRTACEARVSGQGQSSGSVQSGGILRSIETPDRSAADPVSAPASSAPLPARDAARPSPSQIP